MGQYFKKMKAMFERDAIDTMFQIKSYHAPSELFWVYDQHADKHFLSATLLCAALPGSMGETPALLKSMLSADFPEETFLTINIVSSTYVEPLISRFAQARGHTMFDANHPERAKLIREYVASRVNLFRSGTQTPLDNDTRVLLKNVYMLVTVKLPIKRAPIIEDFEKNRTFLVGLKSALTSIQVNPTVVNDKEMVFWLRSMLYPDKPASNQFNPDKPIGEQIVDNETDLKVKRDHLRLGEMYVQSLSVLRYPEHMVLPVMGELLGDSEGSALQISCPFIITTHVYMPDMHNLKQTITTKARGIRTQSQGNFGKMIPSLRMKDENFTVLEQSMDAGNRPLKVWTNLLLFEYSHEAMVKQTTSTIGFWEFLGFQLKIDAPIHAVSFQQQFPGNISPASVAQTMRYSTVTTEHAAHLLPVVGDWRGNGTVSNNIFYSHRGQVINYCPFESDSNYNSIITGTAGSGKSTLCNDICMGIFSRGGVVRIIDSGGSYKKLALTLGDDAEYIEFTPNRNIIINPFSEIDGNIEDELPSLLLILEQMAGPKGGLSDYQLSMLEKYTLEAYQQYGDELDITLLSELIIASGTTEDGRFDHNIHQLGSMFHSWTRHGIYGKYMHGKANLTMDGKPFTVLELDSLQSMPQLRVIILLMMIRKLKQEFIQNADKSRIKQLLIDEFWQFSMAKPGESDKGILRVQAFLDESFRVFRKMGANCTVATQALTDLGDESPLIDNAANIIFMKQQSSTVDTIKRKQLLSVSDHTFDRIKKLKRNGSSYSDLFIYTSNRGSGFCRFVIDQFTQLLYTTDPREVAALDKLRQKGMDLPTAINTYIAQNKRVISSD